MAVTLFYLTALICVATTVLALTRSNASHALIYLVVTLLSLAVIFFLLGAPFAAALEIVIYAGAIVILFLFVVMMLNLGRTSVAQEQSWLNVRMWVVPGVLALILLVVLVSSFTLIDTHTSGTMVTPRAVGIALYTEYIIAVELAGVLLLAALVAAYHLARRYMTERRGNE